MTFTDEELDEFIDHWVKCYPAALANLFRYWDELHRSNNRKLLARIIHQKNRAMQTFVGRSKFASNSETTFEFDLAVVDRIRHLRSVGKIPAPRNYPPLDFDV